MFNSLECLEKTGVWDRMDFYAKVSRGQTSGQYSLSDIDQYSSHVPTDASAARWSFLGCPLLGLQIVGHLPEWTRFSCPNNGQIFSEMALSLRKELDASSYGMPGHWTELKRNCSTGRNLESIPGAQQSAALRECRGLETPH